MDETKNVRYNFNEFCRDVGCDNYQHVSVPAGDAHMCTLVGFTFHIIKWHEDCPHIEAMRQAKDSAKEKDIMWKKLNNPSKSLKRIKHEPVRIKVTINDITERVL